MDLDRRRACRRRSSPAWPGRPPTAARSIVLTGDNAFGGDSIAGLGVYRTTDLGAHWTHAAGVPDGVLGFKLAVDPTHPERGLRGDRRRPVPLDRRRRELHQRQPADRRLRTGKPVTDEGLLPGQRRDRRRRAGPGEREHAGDDASPAPCWPPSAGAPASKANADGVAAVADQRHVRLRQRRRPARSPTSTSRATRRRSARTTSLTQARIGRIALGIADGADQDHRVVYALVQDAVKFNGGVAGLDANENGTHERRAERLPQRPLGRRPTSARRGSMIEGSTAIDNDTTSDSALAPPTCKTPAVISYCPGIQAWYNLWVQPDPTQPTASGVPTRLAFGLEEVWQAAGRRRPRRHARRRRASSAATTPASRARCSTRPTACRSARSPDGGTTPQDHDAPRPARLPLGPRRVGRRRDARSPATTAASTSSTSTPGDELSNDNWGRGANNGMNTLQPYDAAMAKDGTVYMGLQDNGEGKIDPDGKAYTVFGGDGFFTAVDPDNSDVAFEEYVGGDIAATKDGGKTWTDIQPANIDGAAFATPFEMDAERREPPDDRRARRRGDDRRASTRPRTRGRRSTTSAPRSTRATRAPTAADDDPDNQLSAVDVQVGQGPGRRADRAEDEGLRHDGRREHAARRPGARRPARRSTRSPARSRPGTYEDTPFTIGKDDGDAAVLIDVKGATDADDWDLFVYHDDGDRQADGGRPLGVGVAPSESVNVPNPAARQATSCASCNFHAAGQYYADRHVHAAHRLAAAGQHRLRRLLRLLRHDHRGHAVRQRHRDERRRRQAGQGRAGDGWHIAKAAGPARAR